MILLRALGRYRECPISKIQPPAEMLPAPWLAWPEIAGGPSSVVGGQSRLRTYAPLAFHNLNTPRSLEGLAAIVSNTDAGTYESMKSADYLAEGGDPKWYPLLHKTAEKHSSLQIMLTTLRRVGAAKFCRS
jgi:hypothetical protein